MTVKDLGLCIGKFLFVTVTLMIPALMTKETMPVVFAVGVILFMGLINILNEFTDVTNLCNNEYFIIGIWVYFVVSCVIAYMGINVAILQPIVLGIVIVYSGFFIGRYMYLKGK